MHNPVSDAVHHADNVFAGVQFDMNSEGIKRGKSYGNRFSGD